MITSPTPIVEKMTLFWHGHFVSSEDKVNDAKYMYAQNKQFRANLLGSFPAWPRAWPSSPPCSCTWTTTPT